MAIKPFVRVVQPDGASTATPPPTAAYLRLGSTLTEETDSEFYRPSAYATTSANAVAAVGDGIAVYTSGETILISTGTGKANRVEAGGALVEVIGDGGTRKDRSAQIAAGTDRLDALHVEMNVAEPFASKHASAAKSGTVSIAASGTVKIDAGGRVLLDSGHKASAKQEEVKLMTSKANSKFVAGISQSLTIGMSFTFTVGTSVGLDVMRNRIRIIDTKYAITEAALQAIHSEFFISQTEITGVGNILLAFFGQGIVVDSRAKVTSIEKKVMDDNNKAALLDMNLAQIKFGANDVSLAAADNAA